MPTKFPLSSVWVAPSLMSTPLARLPEIRLPWGGRTNTGGRGIVAAGRLTADEVPRGAVGHENAVLRVAALERAAGIRADIVHGDLIAAGAVDADAVAAVAADDVGELEADVDRRLMGNMPEPLDDEPDHLVAGHRIVAGSVWDWLRCSSG